MFGRGRGRGGFGGGGYRGAPSKPFECFPDIELPDKKKVAVDTEFATYNYKLQAYWESSPYFVGEGASEKRSKNEDIERYSDSKKPRYQTKQQSFSDYMKLAPGYFPLELVQGVKIRAPKKVKWSSNADSKKLDFLEKLDNKSEGKKEDEEEDGEEEEEEEDEEYSDDGDYEQNVDFDDDDDDFNDADDGDDEPCY